MYSHTAWQVHPCNRDSALDHVGHLYTRLGLLYEGRLVAQGSTAELAHRLTLPCDVDLSLMDQKTMIFMTTQAVLLLGSLAVAVVAADMVAGERERGTLEALLAAPVSRSQLLGGHLIGALAPWFTIAVIALPYLATVSVGSGGFLLTVVYLLGTGTVLALGVGAWTLGLSARADSVRNSTLMALIVYASLAVPAVLSSPLRGNWFGRLCDLLDPFSLEDWIPTPEALRTATLAPGARLTGTRRLRMIQASYLAVFATAVTGSLLSVTNSQPLVLPIGPTRNLTPATVLPVALGVPLVLLGSVGMLFWRRRTADR